MDILKKMPIWLIALALIIAAAFIGYGIYDNRKVDLWPPRIYPKEKTVDFLPQSEQVKYLNNYSEVLEKATEVINDGETELWVAVDIPACGAIGQPQGYKKYREALFSAAAKTTLTTKKIIWFSNEIEQKYNKNICNLNDSELKIMNDEDRQLRKVLSDNNVVETDIPILAMNNFWMSKKKNGSVRAVIEWQAIDPVTSSQLVGIYTESPHIESLLKAMWGMWKKQTDEKFSATLIKMYQ